MTAPLSVNFAASNEFIAGQALAINNLFLPKTFKEAEFALWRMEKQVLKHNAVQEAEVKSYNLLIGALSATLPSLFLIGSEIHTCFILQAVQLQTPGRFICGQRCRPLLASQSVSEGVHPLVRQLAIHLEVCCDAHSAIRYFHSRFPDGLRIPGRRI